MLVVYFFFYYKGLIYVLNLFCVVNGRGCFIGYFRGVESEIRRFWEDMSFVR